MTSTSGLNMQQKLLMGPGPSNVHGDVLAAMAQPTIGHLDPDFVELMQKIKAQLQYAYQTKNELTFPVSAPGSAGMETCFMNLLEPGEKVVICENGVFGMRMAEVARRAGADVVVLKQEWGEAVDLEKADALLAEHSDAVVFAFVYAETSTGIRSDAKGLCALAKKHGCLSIVDTVTAVGGIELKVDEWGVDAAYCGTQKCLSVPPGISPVTFSDAAAQKVADRKTPVISWFLDLTQVMAYWGGKDGKRAYHHTAPVNAMYALYEGLYRLQEEGLEAAHKRHAELHNKLKAALAALGLTYAVDEALCLPQLNPITIPEGVDDAAVRTELLSKHNIEIGAGLGKFAGNVWRIGLMGESCRLEHIQTLISGLADTLNNNGFACDKEKALAALS